MDAFTHELDARYAIGAELPDEHPAFPGAFELLANGFAAAATVTAPRYDRALPA